MQIPLTLSRSQSLDDFINRSDATGSRSIEGTQQEIKYQVAISATEFGKFNYMLLAIAFSACYAAPFETITMSYVFPAAQCDLNLSLSKNGCLNAGVYIGDFLWGYLCDAFGRQKIMVVTFCLDAVIVVTSGLSQSFSTLFGLKILGGFVVTGAQTGLLAYVPELHPSKYRAKVQMITAIAVSCATITLPILASLILPLNIKITHPLKIHSWNIFLLVCAIPSLLGSILFVFMPESPKFLMTIGRNGKALTIFKQIFTCNTGKNSEEFPIKRLVDETKLGEKTRETNGRTYIIAEPVNTIKESCFQIKMLCSRPHIRYFLLVCSIQVLNMFSVQSIRLWIPAIFQSISDYKYYHNGSSASFCTMLKMMQPSTNSNGTCQFIYSASVYGYTLVTILISIIGYMIAGLLISKLGRKILLCLSSFIGGSFVISLYFARNTATVLALTSIFLLCGSICLNIILLLVIELFPLTYRPMTVFCVMTIGKIGAMLGNLTFSSLLKVGCAPPFIVIGLLVMVSSILASLLPKTQKGPKEEH